MSGPTKMGNRTPSLKVLETESLSIGNSHMRMLASLAWDIVAS